MGYTIDRTFCGDAFGAIVERTRAALSSEGFGVLTEIDVKATLKEKIYADVDDYLILGACNPNMAYKAMQIETYVGAMLIVRGRGGGLVEVSAIDPVVSMAAVGNDALKAVAGQVRRMLEVVVADI